MFSWFRRNKEYFAHPTAVIDKGAEIAPGCKIWHFSHIMGGAKLGEGCNIGQNVVISPQVLLGRNCKVQNNVSLYEGVVLEENPQIDLRDYIANRENVSGGDVNEDGKADASDAAQVLQSAVGKRKLTTKQTKTADMNADGRVNASDAIEILQQAVKKR